MSPDEIKALLLKSARGRFSGSGDAITIGLGLIPDELQDEVITWVEDNGGRVERRITRSSRRRVTPPLPKLGPTVLVIPRSALF